MHSVQIHQLEVRHVRLMLTPLARTFLPSRDVFCHPGSRGAPPTSSCCISMLNRHSHSTCWVVRGGVVAAIRTHPGSLTPTAEHIRPPFYPRPHDGRLASRSFCCTLAVTLAATAWPTAAETRSATLSATCTAMSDTCTLICATTRAAMRSDIS